MGTRLEHRDFRMLIVVVLALVLGASVSAQQRRAPTSPRTAVPILRGSEGNAWTAAAVGVNGTSAALDTQWAMYCSAFGSTSAATTLTVQYSQNGTTFYSSATNTGAVTGHFGMSFNAAARYIRLISNDAATISATLACKSGD